MFKSWMILVVAVVVVEGREEEGGDVTAGVTSFSDGLIGTSQTA